MAPTAVQLNKLFNTRFGLATLNTTGVPGQISPGAFTNVAVMFGTGYTMISLTPVNGAISGQLLASTNDGAFGVTHDTRYVVVPLLVLVKLAAGIATADGPSTVAVHGKSAVAAPTPLNTDIRK